MKSDSKNVIRSYKKEKINLMQKVYYQDNQVNFRDIYFSCTVTKFGADLIQSGVCLPNLPV